MTTAETEHELLERRTRQLSRVRSDNKDDVTVSRVVVVSVGSEVLGIPTHYIDEVIRAPLATPLAHLPHWMTGVFQHRGELMTGVDLGAWLHQGKLSRQTPPPFVVLVNDEKGLAIGLCVDSVIGFREVRQDELVAQFGTDNNDSRPITAITRDLLALLDMERLFDDPEFGRATTKNSHAS